MAASITNGISVAAQGAITTTLYNTYTVNVITEYGTTGSYGTTYKTEQITITPENYSSYAQIIENQQIAQVADLEAKVLDTKTGSESGIPTGAADAPKVTTTYDTKKYEAAQMFNIITEWSVGNSSYSNQFKVDSITIDASNYRNRESIVEDYKAEHLAAFESFVKASNLNSLPLSFEKVWGTTSGNVYMKTTFSLVSQGTGNATLSYQTVYGLTTQYGFTLSNNKQITLQEHEYEQLASRCESIVSTEELNNLQYQLAFLNTAIPESTPDTYKATNNITYHFKTEYSMSSRSMSLYQIRLSTYYGTSANQINTLYSEVTVDITPNNHATAQTALENKRAGEVKNLKVYLDTLIGTITYPEVEDQTYIARNGKNYTYKVYYTLKSQSPTEAIIEVKTKYGLNNYSNTFATEEVSVTPATFAALQTTLETKTSTQARNLRTYLDTLIGDVLIMGAKTHIEVTKSGKRFYIRTVFSKESSSETDYVMKYVTEYGPTFEYGTEFSSKLLNINITNFYTYESDLSALADVEIDRVKASLNVWNVDIPEGFDDSWENPCGLTYYYRVVYSQGEPTDTTNAVVYKIFYGRSQKNIQANLYSQQTHTFNAINYASVSTDVDTKVQREIEQLKQELSVNIGDTEFVDIVGSYSAPNKITYYFKTSFNEISRTNSEAQVEIKTIWGESTKFGNTFKTDVVTLDKENYNGYKTVVSNVANQHNLGLTTYLDTLNGPITTPNDIELAYTTNSGKIYYFKVTYEKVTENERNCVIKYETYYGTNKDELSLYSTKNHNITIETYLNYLNDCLSLGNAEIQEIKRTFGLFEVQVPADTQERWKNACNQYYYIRTHYYQGQYSETENQFIYSISYGKNETEDEANPDTVYNSNEFTFNEETYKNVAADIKTVADQEVREVKEFLQYHIGPVKLEAETGEYNAANGSKYFYKVDYIELNREDESTNIRCEIVYGTSDEYGISYKVITIPIDATNYVQYTLEVQTVTAGLVRDLKAYLDTLLNQIELPDTKVIAYETASGKMFYIRVSYMRQKSSLTEYIVDYTTEYGDTTDYGTVFSTKTYSITSEKYNVYVRDLNLLAQNEINAVKKNFGLWEIQIPTPVTEVWDNMGNERFYLQVLFEQAATSNTTNTIEYITSFGTTEEDYGKFEYARKTRIFTLDDYMTAYSVLDELARTEIANLKNYLNTPNITLPNNYSEVYEKNNFKYSIQIVYSKGNSANQVITNVTVDGMPYGDAIIQDFYTLASAFEILNSDQETLITTIKGLLDNSPEDTYEDYTVDGMSFRVETKYTKTANTRIATVRTYLDGVAYKSSTQKVEIDEIIEDLAACATLGYDNVSKLEQSLALAPMNDIQEYIVDGLRFNVGTQYTKLPGSVTASFYTLCDDVKYYTGSQVINASTVETNLKTMKTAAEAKLNEMLEKVNMCPSNSFDVLTVNGFKYDLGIQYLKQAGSKQATVKAVLDGVDYGTTLLNLTIDSIENDIRTMVSSAETSRDVLFNITKNSPANVERAYTVNGFKYTISTTYVKNINDTNVTISTFLDNGMYKVSTKTVTAGQLTNDLNECINEAERISYELKQILNGSPADDYDTPYMIDGFNYTVGAKYEKLPDSQNILVNILLDGALHSSYYDKISAQSVRTDIENLIITAQNAIAELKATLRGIPSQLISYSIKGFNFDLSVLYKKNEDGTVSIVPYIDTIQYKDAEIEEFDADNIDKYTDKGKELIKSMKNLVTDLSPNNISEVYSVHGFKFNVGIEFEKESGVLGTNLYTTLDGARIGNPDVVEYNVTSIGNLTTRANAIINNLKNRLNLTPADYVKTYTVGGFNFAVGSKFSKFAGSNDVRIITTLDGADYGAASIKTFMLDNLNALLIEAETKEGALKSRLDTCPKDTTEKYTIKRFNFNIGSVYNKEANSDVITTLVKLDGTQYSQYHQITFDIDNISSFTNYNERVISELKARLFTAVPEDIHTTYSRNKFNFTIDAYFSKQENSDVIDIECTIDSADLNNTISTLNYTPEIKAGIADTLKKNIDMNMIQQKLKNVRS